MNGERATLVVAEPPREVLVEFIVAVDGEAHLLALPLTGELDQDHPATPEGNDEEVDQGSRDHERKKRECGHTLKHPASDVLVPAFRQPKARRLRREVPSHPRLYHALTVWGIKPNDAHQTPTFTKGLYAQVTKQYVIELYNKDNKYAITSRASQRTLSKVPRQ